MLNSKRDTRSPLKRALAVLERRWSGELLHQLLGGERSFVELKDELWPITPRMLARRLEEFEKSGLVTCRVERWPVRTFYSLAATSELRQMFSAIRAWGRKL